MPRVSVRDVDRGASKMLDRLHRMNLQVSVGVHAAQAGEAEKDSEMTVGEVAAIHEYGLGVPQRSWLRGFVDENRPKLERMLVATNRQVAAGKMTPEIAMARFGLAVQGMMRERVVNGINPPLQESTKRRKQELTGGPKDTPLILWGQLLSSILHEVSKR